jgi:hypothetical protein
MKPDIHPFYVRKRVRDVVMCAGSREWSRTVKVTQLYLPRFDSAARSGLLKAAFVLILFAAAFFFTDKMKEVAPFVVSVLEQLH